MALMPLRRRRARVRCHRAGRGTVRRRAGRRREQFRLMRQAGRRASRCISWSMTASSIGPVSMARWRRLSRQRGTVGILLPRRRRSPAAAGTSADGTACSRLARRARDHLPPGTQGRRPVVRQHPHVLSVHNAGYQGHSRHRCGTLGLTPVHYHHRWYGKLNLLKGGLFADSRHRDPNHARELCPGRRLRTRGGLLVAGPRFSGILSMTSTPGSLERSAPERAARHRCPRQG
jgi:hypothetical protein